MIALELDPSVNAESIYLQLMDNGLLVGQKENVLRFMPPLVIEELHIDKLVGMIDQLLTSN